MIRKKFRWICFLLTGTLCTAVLGACTDPDDGGGNNFEPVLVEPDGVVEKSGDDFLYSNSDIRMTVSESGIIKSVSTSDGRTVLRGQALQAKLQYSTSDSMWEARVWQEKEAGAATVEAGKNDLVVHYSSFPGTKVSVKMNIRLKGDNIYFYNTAENKGGGTVVAVEAPYFTGLEVLENDNLRLPDRNGVRIEEPLTTNNTFDVREMRYPVNMSFQMMTYGNDDASVAIRCEDSEMSYKDLLFGGEEKAFAIRQYPFVGRGDHVKMPAVVLKCAREDWHAASVDYANWWFGFAKRPVWVDYLKDFPTTTATEEPHWNPVDGTPPATMDELVAATQDDLRMGYDATQLQTWWNPTGSEGSYDYQENTKWPDYEYSSVIRDKYGLAEFVERVQTTGLQIGFFQNARLASPDSQWSKEEWMIRPAVSEKYATTETWFGKTFSVMCPATEYFDALYERQSEFAWAGLNFMQLDQIGAAPSFLCFGKNHGHSTPATAWKEGYLDQYLSKMSGLSEKYGIWYWTEGVWEGASQYVQVSHRAKMYGSEEPSYDCPEYFEFTFPGYRLWGDAWSGGVPVWNFGPGQDGVKILKANADFYRDSYYKDVYGLTAEGASAVWNQNDGLGEIVVLAKGNSANAANQAVIRLDKQKIGGMSLKSFTQIGYLSDVTVSETDTHLVVTVTTNGTRLGGARIVLNKQ